MTNQDLSKRFSTHWKECAEYAEILGVTKNEVHIHFKFIKKYDGQIRENKQTILSRINRELAMNNKKVDDFELMDDFKVIMWTIKKVGGLERAEKLFQAAKLVIETNRDRESETKDR